MVQPISPTITAPLANAATSDVPHDTASSSVSGTAPAHHHHHGSHHGQQSAEPSKSSLPWQPGGGTLSAAYAGMSRSV